VTDIDVRYKGFIVMGGDPGNYPPYRH
jgi:hypothetical protein